MTIIKNMSFEDALTELEEIVKKIDAGKESLESTINIFERAVLLKSHCEKMLTEAKLKIDKITQDNDGIITTTPVEN